MNLKDFLASEQGRAQLKAWGEPDFRLRQLNQWTLERFAASYDEMSNLPRGLRQRLAEVASPFALEVVERLQDPGDGTVKWLSRLEDGHTVETVLLRVPDRTTVCISTQVGCPVRCVFCASGRNGLVRNLTAGEIMDQVMLASREVGKRVDNIVVMGMGEPLLNLEALVPALERIAFGVRHVTISTSGIVPGILKLARLAEEAAPSETSRNWNLALSLHGVDDESRARIIPSHHRYPLEEIFQACRVHREKTGRMLTLEYALVRGQNDSQDAQRRLAEIARELRAKVNLIPCNPNASALEAPELRRCRQWAEDLCARGVQATLRHSRGQAILAACGQLRQQWQRQSRETADR
ncbi:MAG: 23S rRNA (adenine(2503)-C(2))-methyltransferase RlmN [Oligosphaeraceae bacterium]